MSRSELPRRLRELRELQWPEAGITQAQLAEALGGNRPLSVSLISSWENTDKPVRPPVRRLEAYATLFATRRSMSAGTLRVLPVEELTDEERAERKGLLDELLLLREGKSADRVPQAEVWKFNEGEDITIVCAQLPAKLRKDFSYADPESADFASLYTYADPDALIELFGHIRAKNPENTVTFHTNEELTPDHYTTHLVLLGGVDWNTVTRDVIERVDLPVLQVVRDGNEPTSGHGGFEVERDGEKTLFPPALDSRGRLLEDVAHFYRGVSPFNRKRTVTVCNGMYGRGTLGAVRALTDIRFRDRNQAYLSERFGGAESFSIISRVPVVAGMGLTPDWTLEENRLHEWPEAAT
ncbi:helix-turn-helix transcriptional regulator [Amycolatopsis sp. SID8362]|uniref:helix-turn-helix domain-containing protein n=1 Tax=Amycolatopsis sp. SID8362 TaxID=2690346 RepID=UPI001370A738|nr:helix-turn-helix transcriptional regulator [Amycolatopsis sp. SID8362]NBH10142.1 helix-turn-helix domain-containing protein [Amycolatopsis sp. SID8362]NED46837.1 helix-turn-helix transcriptional regulator [Amycolatopsis sp. SID8362]